MASSLIGIIFLPSSISRPEGIAPKILGSIGCEVIELDCNLDYTFPKYNPNPEDVKMLKAIAKTVMENNGYHVLLYLCVIKRDMLPKSINLKKNVYLFFSNLT